jgi:ankyrin repeat protein
MAAAEAGGRQPMSIARRAAAAPQSAAAKQAVQDERLRRTLSITLLEFADEGHIEGVMRMLDAGADVNAEIPGDGSPLIVAADEGHLDVVRLLLDRGANPNIAVPGDGSPLIAAAGEGHIDVVQLLLDRGANVNQVVDGDENALIQASDEGHLDIVKLLVSRGADVNAGVWVEAWRWTSDGFREPAPQSLSQYRTPLSVARREGHVDIVAYLISAGARD